MRRVTEEEWHALVMEGTRTAKVATARKDGRPHVVPVWFVLDGEDVVFTTGAGLVKGQALRREPYACLCVDDQAPFSFVMVEGPVELSTDLDECAAWRPGSAGVTWDPSEPKSSGRATRRRVSCSSAYGRRTRWPRRTWPTEAAGRPRHRAG
jgi:PPOX class probable F420-dependent enzyme